MAATERAAIVIYIEAVAMLLIGILGFAVVATERPVHQVIVLGAFSIAMIVLFTVLHTPDVVLSAIVVGALAYPMMVLLALAKVRSRESSDDG
jgi:uncharacterized MnhB-related membrane protein